MIQQSEELIVGTLSQTSVMIVDDLPVNLDLLTGILVSEGYHVNAFPSGKLALDAVEIIMPDLIILYINLLDMDGFEVCENLKKIESIKSVPVIFISAITDTQEKLKAFTNGGVDYIENRLILRR
ncbi:MAG: response regulator [Gammaproteobacteria bacterium]|nr:response regulator [Gammaproteobacteria bacterium]